MSSAENRRAKSAAEKPIPFHRNLYASLTPPSYGLMGQLFIRIEGKLTAAFPERPSD
jgi:hypothetical protein